MSDVFEALDALWTLLSTSEADVAGIRTFGIGESVEGGEIRVGLDTLGRRHLLVPASNSPVVTDDRASGVHIREQALEQDGASAVTYVDVVCQYPPLDETFASLASEIVVGLRSGDASPNGVAHRVLENWRHMIEEKRGNLLGIGVLIGLVGEMVTLVDILQAGGGLATWTGPAGALHDFSGHSWAVEVKSTTTRNGRIVTINDLRQLEAPEGGRLALRFLRLERTADGYSIPKLIDMAVECGAQRAAILTMLEPLGYRSLDAAEYASVKFTVVESVYFAVEGDFPRLVPQMLSHGVPSGVLGVAYDINISGPSPAPLPERDVEAIMETFAG